MPKHNFELINQTLIDYLNRCTLTKFQALSEELSLKFLCDVFFPLLPGQSNISCFAMANLQLDNPRNQISQITSNRNKKPLTIYQGHLEELNLKLLCGVIILSFSSRSHKPYFKKEIFNYVATPLS